MSRYKHCCHLGNQLPEPATGGFLQKKPVRCEQSKILKYNYQRYA